MTEHILEKIEHIRTMPEHIKLRYTVGAVAVCMLFVIGIWFLTLKQGFLDISPEIKKGKNQAEETMNQVGNTFSGTDSLRDLQERRQSIRLDSQGNAEDFVNDELKTKNTNFNNPGANQIPQ